MPLKYNNRVASLLVHQTVWCYCFLNIAFNPVIADEFDTIQFNASVNKAWDNNLFRLSDNEVSDQITTYTAGVHIDKQYSLQRFIVNLNYVDNKYQRNDFLDFDTVNYDAEWQWALTPSLTGSLYSSKNKTLNGFSDFRSFTQNIRTTEINRFRAEYSPHKVWALIAGLTETDTDNSQTFNAVAQYSATAFDYGARYTYPSGSNLSFLGHKRNGQFQRPLSQVGLFDNGFTEDEFELDFVLRPTGKSKLSSKLGYLSREYDNFTVRNYDSWLGYVRYDLLLTGKVKANFDLSRLVNPFETNYSTYTVTDALQVGLSYDYSEKVIFNLNTRIAQRDFRQSVVPGIDKRADDEKSFSGSITWQPIRNIGFTLNSIKSSRNASSAYNNFDYDDVTTSVIVDLKI